MSRPRLPLFRFGGLFIVPVLFFQPLSASANMEAAARNFQQNCAVCHGASGHPDPDSALVKSLGVMPADFADPLFNSREPADDWFLVIKNGGPALGFSEVMPAFGEQFSDDEIRDLVEYIKSDMVGDHGYPPGELNLFLPLRTKKAFPEDEVVWKVRYTDDDGYDEWKNTIEFEKRFGKRFQAVLEMSHRFDDGDEKFSNLEPGGKYVLYFNRKRGLIATLGGNIGIPLEPGDHSVEILPYLAVGKVLSDDFTFQGSARAKLPWDEVDQGSLEFSGIVHWTHTPWPRSVFPGLEMTVEVPLDRGPGVDVARFSLTPQTRIGLSKRGHVAVNLGVEVPLNDTDRYDYRGYMFLIWDFADGAFWAGW
ncbi:MAG: cytochrome c [Gammaproteobacteria bacterium]